MIKYCNLATNLMRNKYMFPRFKDPYMLEKSIIRACDMLKFDEGYYSFDNFPKYETVYYCRDRTDIRWMPIEAVYLDMVKYIKSLNLPYNYSCLIEDIVLTRTTYIGYGRNGHESSDMRYNIIIPYIRKFHIDNGDKTVIFPMITDYEGTSEFLLISVGTGIYENSWFVKSNYQANYIRKTCINITDTKGWYAGGGYPGAAYNVLVDDNLPDKSKVIKNPTLSTLISDCKSKSKLDTDIKYGNFPVPRNFVYNITKPGIVTKEYKEEDKYRWGCQ